MKTDSKMYSYFPLVKSQLKTIFKVYALFNLNLILNYFKTLSFTIINDTILYPNHKVKNGNRIV